MVYLGAVWSSGVFPVKPDATGGAVGEAPVLGGGSYPAGLVLPVPRPGSACSHWVSGVVWWLWE